MDNRDAVTAKLTLIDRHVGQRLRAIRRRRKVTQATLGRYLGVKFQQVQKYESGRNRLSAGRLLLLSKICHVPLHYFYQGLRLDFTAEKAALDDEEI